jgi:arylsulfatase A-like enzyme
MGLRGDAIVQFDWSVGEIVKALEKAGIRENTLIILTSDNGPVVDDGYADQAVEKLKNHKPWGPYRGGKYSAFEAGTRVPFIVNWRGRITPKKSEALVSQIDMLATLAKLAEVDISGKEVTDSRNQLEAWLGNDEKGRDYIIGSADGLTLLTRQWKYIEPNNGASYNPSTNTELGNDRQDQLYDMLHDRGEYDNVAAENPLVVRFLKEIIQEEKSKGVGMSL